MGWSTPATWVAGTVVTASDMNTYIRDNQRYLKGIGQVPTIESGLTIDNSDGDERLLLPLLSTAECTTVLNAEGEVAFDEQTHQMKEYDGTAVRALISEADVDDTPVNGATTVPVSSNWAYDHVAAADPHTGYVLESLLDAAGDIYYATADNTPARLAIGTANQLLRTNAGATAPEWASIGMVSSSGSYVGNDAQNRAIPHGLSVTPKIVFIHVAGALRLAFNISGSNLISANSAAGAWVATTVTTWTSTNFYVGDAGSTIDGANQSGNTWLWVAIG